MANLLNTSFVPQQPLLRVESASARPHAVNFALLLSLVLFFVALAVGGGVYFYHGKIQDRLDQRTAELSAIEATFNLDEIASYKKLQTSLSSAKALVEEHVIFSVVFRMIEERIAQNIGLTALGYGISSDTGNVILTLSGQAPGYTAVYFQAEQFRATGPHIKKVDVGALSLDNTTGIVDFSFTIEIDTKFVQSAVVLRQAKEAEIRAQQERDVSMQDVPNIPTSSATPLPNSPTTLP